MERFACLAILYGLTRPTLMKSPVFKPAVWIPKDDLAYQTLGCCNESETWDRADRLSAFCAIGGIRGYAHRQHCRMRGHRSLHIPAAYGAIKADRDRIAG